MKNKVTFTHEGVEYKDIEFQGEYCTGRGLSKTVKTFCKKVLNLSVSTSYSSFSGGDSLRVTVKDDIDFSYDDLSAYEDQLQAMFEYGAFDMYTDMQTYKDCNFNKIVSESGKKYKVSVKYLSLGR